MAKIGGTNRSKYANNVRSIAEYRGKTKRDAIISYLAFITSLIALFKAFRVF